MNPVRYAPSPIFSRRSVLRRVDVALDDSGRLIMVSDAFHTWTLFEGCSRCTRHDDIALPPRHCWYQVGIRAPRTRLHRTHRVYIFHPSSPIGDIIHTNGASI